MDYFSELYEADYADGHYHLIWYPNHTFEKDYAKEVQLMRQRSGLE